MDGRGDRETSTVNNIGPVTITTPGDRQIVITRLFDAPRPLVFEAWTKAEHVARWWDPSGVPLAVCEIDLRPTGTFRWVNRAPDGGEGHAFCGTYREISPPARLVFGSSPGQFATLVFTEEGKKTRLTMTMSARPGRNATPCSRCASTPARPKRWRTSLLTFPRWREAAHFDDAKCAEAGREAKQGGSMKRITVVLIAAIVAFGMLAIQYSGGRAVTSTGENRTTTSRDGTIIAYTKRGSGPR